MRLGCLGCLLLVALGLLVAVVALGVLFLSSNIFGTPDIRPVPYSRSDGYSAQQKLFEVAVRQAGRSSRRDPVVLTEPEANALLGRHLDQAGLPLSPLIVRFNRGQLVIQGKTPLRNLVKSPLLAQALPYLLDKRLDEPVWVTVRGRLKVEGAGDRRQLAMNVDEFALGTQHLGSFLLWTLMGPSGGGVLQWPVPAAVESVRVGDGQLAILTR